VFQGRRNYTILALAVCFAVTGSVLTGLSKWEVWNNGHQNTTTAITTATSDAVTTTTTFLTTSSN